MGIVILSLLYFLLFISCFWIIVFLDNLAILWDDPKSKKKYSISAIIPAYNEEKAIIKTINSLLAQDYPKDLFEIIVVNDGSTDNTKSVCEDFAKKGLITLINKRNGGKASAMNKAIKVAKNELIYVLDADSFAQKDSFKQLIGYFNNPKVAAVTSSMEVTSKNTMVQKIQWIEYFFSIFMRKIMSLFNCLYVTPGPGSIYRKKVILEVGGFSENTLTEDMEIAFNIQNHGYIIENSLNSKVLTNTPDKLSALIKQRRRWYTGFIEDSISYKHFYMNKKNGFLGMFLLPTNVLSVGILIFLVLHSLRKLFYGTISSFSKMNSINFDIFSIIKTPSFSKIFFSIDIFLIIGLITLFFSMIIIYYSLKTSNQRINIKKNFIDYISYFALYSFLMAYFWADSIIYKIFLRRDNVGWKYGKSKA